MELLMNLASALSYSHLIADQSVEVFAIAHFAWGFIADTTRDCDVQSQFRRFL
jgi:hypothetical protein